MKLIRVYRQFSIKETWINVDAITVVVEANDYEKGACWSVVMNNGLTYDITDESKQVLTCEIK